MLVLTRKKGETIVIGNEIEVTVVEIDGDQIRLGINAPRDVTIVRKEILLAVKEENKSAIVTGQPTLGDLAKIIEEKQKK